MVLRANEPCPTDDELLRLASGDLSRRHATRVRAHIDICDTCRAHMAESTMALRAFQANTEDESDVPQWANFKRALHREEDAWRERRYARTRRRWSGAAAVAATLIVAIIWQRQAEVTLNAETVVSRAIAYERQQPTQARTTIWIQHSPPSSRPHTSSIAATSQQSDASYAASQMLVPTSDSARELTTRLAAYGFDPSAPLSARHFQQWRQSASISAEHLATVPAPNGALLKVAASTARGDVREAELIVRDGTYEPVSQQWQFADGYRVAVTSIAPTTPSREMRADTVVLPAPPTPGRTPIDLEATELAVRTALHNAGVPVGLQITVTRSDNRVLVQGDVSSESTLTEVRNLLRTSQAVRLAVQPSASIPAPEVASDAGGLEPWLQQSFPDAISREQFVSKMNDAGHRLRTTASVLADLAGRYRPDVAAGLTSNQQRSLDTLALRQFADLTNAYVALEQHLSPLVGTVSRPMLPGQLPQNWQDGVLAANQAVADLSRAIASVSATPPAKTEDVVSSARRAIRPALAALASALAGQSEAQ